MMTMTMMQRILQNEERTNMPSCNVESEIADRKPLETFSYQFAATTASIIADKEESSQFLRTFSQPRLVNNNLKENFLKFDRNDSLCKSFFGCDDRVPAKNAEHAFHEYEKQDGDDDSSDKNYRDECSRRLSCDSDDSMDAHPMVTERVSSEEECGGAKDEGRSPVDLTSSRRLPMETSEFMTSEESTLDSCRNERVIDGPRKLAFSVENILDPNKFTGKQLEEAKEKVQPFNWRPHLDFVDSSSVSVSRPGNQFISLLITV